MTTDRNNSGLLRASEAARRLGVHPVTLARWSERGLLPPPVRLGPGQRRHYRAADIDALAQVGAPE